MSRVQTAQSKGIERANRHASVWMASDPSQDSANPSRVALDPPAPCLLTFHRCSKSSRRSNHSTSRVNASCVDLSKSPGPLESRRRGERSECTKSISNLIGAPSSLMP